MNNGPIENGPDLTTLGVLRDRLVDGYDWLLTHKSGQADFQAGLTRFSELITRYIVELTGWVMAVVEDDPDALRVLQREYERRLNKGWQMEDSPAVAERFHTVLREYEVVLDARRGAEKAHGDLRARLHFVQATRPVETYRVMQAGVSQ